MFVENVIVVDRHGLSEKELREMTIELKCSYVGPRDYFLCIDGNYTKLKEDLVNVVERIASNLSTSVVSTEKSND